MNIDGDLGSPTPPISIYYVALAEDIKSEPLLKTKVLIASTMSNNNIIEDENSPVLEQLRARVYIPVSRDSFFQVLPQV